MELWRNIIDNFNVIARNEKFAKYPPKIAKYFHLMGNRIYKNYDIVCDTVERNVKMIVDFNDGISGIIFNSGYYHYNLTCFLQKNVKHGWVCVDGGASIGWFSCLLGNLVGNDGKVLSFECNPYIYDNIKRNIGLNLLNNVDVFPIALGSEKKPSRFVCYPHSGHGHFLHDDKLLLYRPNKNKIIDTVTVDVDTLDNFYHNNFFDRLDLIKLDVEGFEFDVLKGAKKVLKRFHPIIIYEFNNQWDSYDFLRNLGYDLFLLDDVGGLVNIDDSNVKRNDNIVAKVDKDRELD